MLRIAHRGASGYAAENTLTAFKKAISIGCDMIELDVRVCASGELVVCHDLSIERTTTGIGKIKDLTLAEIQQYPAKNGNECIPTLEEALDAINKKVTININTKETEAIQPTADIIEAYVSKKGWQYENFIISSPKVFRLKRLKKAHPNILISPIIVFAPRFWTRIAYDAQPHSMQVYYRIVNEKLIEDLKAKNINLYVWTVNSKKDIQKMKELDVSGIITDYPDKI